MAIEWWRDPKSPPPTGDAGAQAFLISKDKAATEFVGNRTECALLVLLRGWGVSYEVLRTRHAGDVEQLYAFSSERKMASVLMRTPAGFCLYNKARACAHRGKKDDLSLAVVCSLATKARIHLAGA